MSKVIVVVAPRLVIAASIFACLLLTGCGTSEYDRRYQEKIDDLWRLEPFLQLQDDSTSVVLSDDEDAVSAQLRLPNFFAETDRLEPAKTGDETIDPERLLPPFVRSLPNFRFTVEHFFGRTGQAKLPIYFYACATESNREPFQSAMERALKKSHKGVEVEWKSSKCDTPDRSQIEWNRASLTLAGQTFATLSAEEIEKKPLDGRVEIFTYSDDDRHVMFIFRMPNDLEESIDLSRLAKAVAGTLTWSDRESNGE